MGKGYKFRNDICPRCKEQINPYSYTFSKDGDKIHLECETTQERMDKLNKVVKNGNQFYRYGMG